MTPSDIVSSAHGVHDKHEIDTLKVLKELEKEKRKLEKKKG